jgi:hypothetical protein
MVGKNLSSPNKELLQSAGVGTNDMYVHHGFPHTSFAH